MTTQLLGDGVLKAFLSFPRITQPVHATTMYDGQTGITICVKFINKHAVCALVRRGDGEYHRIDKVRMEWVIPDAWKGKAVIRELLQFIETEEAKHDNAKTDVA